MEEKNNKHLVQEMDKDIVQESNQELLTQHLESTPTKPKRGRPRKSALAAKTNRGKVGRPAGDAQRIKEFKARLLATSGDKVINKIIQVAMDDEHSGQVACLKMCMDRILPLSLFEEKNGNGSAPQVSINISGMGDKVNISGDKGDVIDG